MNENERALLNFHFVLWLCLQHWEAENEVSFSFAF
jgi:hypothetical protein